MNKAPSLLLLIAGLLHSMGGLAQEGLLRLKLDRGDATIPVYAMRNPQATATLILLPGGDAGTGRIVDGKPGNDNFLSRSRELFLGENFNVLVAYRPGDLSSLDYPYRITREHVAELEKVIAFARQELKKPVWIIGTSRGTVSGVAAAIELGSQIDGLVLTSSVTAARTGSVQTQDIGSIKVPILVVHHRNDACRVSVPSQASRLVSAMQSAPQKKFVLVEGGSDPQGDPCESRHWHGFINFEKETVKLIADWIRNPGN